MTVHRAALLRLFVSTSLIATAQAGWAQQAEQATDGADASGDIVVTGIRRANANAIQSKRNATNIVDVVSATDVRALPDNTIRPVGTAGDR